MSSASPSRASVWLLAIRPKTLPAAAAPVLLGSALAAFRATFDLVPAAAALVGALLIQIATNLANDYYDFRRGGDTEERVGPTRVTQAGLIAPGQVRNATFVVLAAAFLVGVYLVAHAGWPIVWIGLASLLCAVIYTGGPYPLAYHGLGDLFVFVFFGLIAVAGTYYVQALEFTAESVFLGAGVGALSTAILVVNNLRDIETDRTAGKRTLAVRLGSTGTRWEYRLLVFAAFLVPPLGMVWYDWTGWVALSYLALPAVRGPLDRVRGATEPAHLIPALGGTARVLLIYSLAFSAGFLVG